jgi:hypothetical protein
MSLAAYDAHLAEMSLDQLATECHAQYVIWLSLRREARDKLGCVDRCLAECMRRGVAGTVWESAVARAKSERAALGAANQAAKDAINKAVVP